MSRNSGHIRITEIIQATAKCKCKRNCTVEISRKEFRRLYATSAAAAKAVAKRAELHPTARYVIENTRFNKKIEASPALIAQVLKSKKRPVGAPRLVA